MSLVIGKTSLHILYDEYYLFLESLGMKRIPPIRGNTYVCGRTIILGNLI